MYTDLIYPEYVVVDLQTLILAYSYAGKSGQNEIALQLRKTISECEEDSIRILKGSSLYQFLQNCPNIKEDHITLDMIGQALLITYYQKNRGPRKELKSILESWETYMKKGQEATGIEYEIVKLSQSSRQYVLKYHNVEAYLEQRRTQVEKQELIVEKEPLLDKQKKIEYKDVA